MQAKNNNPLNQPGESKLSGQSGEFGVADEFVKPAEFGEFGESGEFSESCESGEFSNLNHVPCFKPVAEELQSPKPRFLSKDLTIPDLTPKYFLFVPVYLVAAFAIAVGSILVLGEIIPDRDPVYISLVFCILNFSIWLGVLVWSRQGTPFKHTIALFFICAPVSWIVFSILGAISSFTGVIGFLTIFAIFYLCRALKFTAANALHLFTLGMLSLTAGLSFFTILMIIIFKATGTYFDMG